MRDPSNGSTTSARRPHDRRLFGAVLRAFYQASDQHDLEAATALLDVLTHLLSSSDSSYRVGRQRSERDFREAQLRLGRLASLNPSENGCEPLGLR